MRISDWSSDVCSSDLAKIDRRDAEIDLQGMQALQVDDVLAHIDIVADADLLEAEHAVERRLDLRLVEHGFFQRDGCLVGLTLREGLVPRDTGAGVPAERSEEHTSELQSLMRISYAVFCVN